MDDLIADFLTETNEGLTQLDNDLVQLEAEPENEELISQIFRVIHTIKGTCGFLGLSRLEKVAHKGEDLLGMFRDKKLPVLPEYISVILESLDTLKLIVAGLEATGQEPEGDDSAIIERLAAIYEGRYEASAAAAPSATVAGADEPSAPVATEAEAEVVEPAAPALSGEHALHVLLEEVHSLYELRQQLVSVFGNGEDEDEDALFASLQEMNRAVLGMQAEGLYVRVLETLGRVEQVSKAVEGTKRLPLIARECAALVAAYRALGAALGHDRAVVFACIDAIQELAVDIELKGKESGKDFQNLLDEVGAALQSVSMQLKNAGISAQQEAPQAEAPKPVAEVQKAAPVPAAKPVAAAKEEVTAAKADTSNQTLRVNVDVLENLMTMVSELVLTRNQLLQVSRQQEKSEFVTPLQHLNHVVSDLQEEVMKTRMQPIGNAWAKLPRIIRDVSTELGKKITLEMHGNETELDRQILDMIKDPLTHMVRNSADHGIETPAERLEKGKPEAGKVVLNAYHQGGHINIVISDDGRGLSLEKIKRKIVQNNLATEEQLAGMSNQQIQQFIFHAGFSTAEAVTAVSGRGVGMDVVRSNIEKIGGSIEMLSEEGFGTTFTIKIPLTLAIVSALIVGVADQRFAIPQLTISELVLVGENNTHHIERISNTSVLRLRGNLLPLVSLSELLGYESKAQDAEYVVVTKVGSTSFGLVVDRVYDLEEIVIKPLSRTLKDLTVYAGNTILGDGCVIMILDPAGILKTVGVSEVVDNQTEEKEQVERTAQEQLLLLFKAGDATLKATPLGLVSRLEEIETADIEYSHGQPVIQYLGHLMPLHLLDAAGNDKERRPMIILQHNGRYAGLLADQILDVAKYYGDIAEQGDDGIADSLIVNDIATDVIDARRIAAAGVSILEGEKAHA